MPGARVRLAGAGDRTSVRPGAPTYCAWAESIYHGIADTARGERTALETSRAGRPADGSDQAPTAVPLLPDESWAQEIDRAARRVWPDGDLPEHRTILRVP